MRKGFYYIYIYDFLEKDHEVLGTSQHSNDLIPALHVSEYACVGFGCCFQEGFSNIKLCSSYFLTLGPILEPWTIAASQSASSHAHAPDTTHGTAIDAAPLTPRSTTPGLIGSPMAVPWVVSGRVDSSST